MKATTRLWFGAVVRLVLVGFAVWFALDADAVPGAPVLTRIALASLFLVLSMLVGEMSALRLDLGLIAAAIRGRAGSTPRDDRAAVDILIRALDAANETTRDAAHRELQRLTGEDLPPDPAAWNAWWAENREGFRGRGEAP